MASVANPARDRVDRSGSNAGGEDRVGEAIDLDDHQGGLVGLRRRSLGHEARDQQAEVRPVAIDPEDRRQQRVEGREHERPDQGGEEPVHLDALCQRGDHEKREDLQEEDEDPQQQQRTRSDECQEDRADDGVEEGHEDDRDDRISETPDRDPGEEPRRQHERDGRDEQGDHQALEQRPRATPPLPQDAGLGRVEVDQPSHGAERSRSPPRRGGQVSAAVAKRSRGRHIGDDGVDYSSSASSSSAASSSAISMATLRAFPIFPLADAMRAVPTIGATAARTPRT